MIHPRPVVLICPGARTLPLRGAVRGAHSRARRWVVIARTRERLGYSFTRRVFRRQRWQQYTVGLGRATRSVLKRRELDIPGKTYPGNRLTGLDEITPANVAQLKKAWITAVKDNGEEEASPIVWNGTVYVSTSHDNVLALDGTSGALKWAFPYSPAYELQYPVNRGVGLENGRLYLVTQDCHLAIDAATGKQVFNVPACHDTSNTWYSMAAYVYKDKVIVGTSGGDLGGSGLVSAFSAQDGSGLGIGTPSHSRAGRGTRPGPYLSIPRERRPRVFGRRGRRGRQPANAKPSPLAWRARRRVQFECRANSGQ